MAAAMTKGRRHCITLDPHRRANSLRRAGTQARHHRIHTAGSTQTRAPAGAQAGMHTRRRGWRGARAPGPIPGARPTQARRRRRIRTAGPTQARRRAGAGGAGAWIPGCIWEISCSHELPDRASLMTM